MNDASEKKPPVGGVGCAALAPVGQVVIDVLSTGHVQMRSTCMGLQDSVYATFADERLPRELAKLLPELRLRAADTEPATLRKS